MAAAHMDILCQCMHRSQIARVTGKQCQDVEIKGPAYVVVLGVVNLHGLGIDGGLQRVILVRQLGQGERHDVLLQIQVDARQKWV